MILKVHKTFNAKYMQVEILLSFCSSSELRHHYCLIFMDIANGGISKVS